MKKFISIARLGDESGKDVTTQKRKANDQRSQET